MCQFYEQLDEFVKILFVISAKKLSSDLSLQTIDEDEESEK